MGVGIRVSWDVSHGKKGTRIWFLSTAIEDHRCLIGLWIAIYCRGLWLLESWVCRFRY